MTPQETLQQLIAEETVEHALERGSSAKDAIQALQTLLHELGFDEELHWERFGADGDYGGGTAAAVKAFAHRNALSGDGEVVTGAIAAKIIARYDNLDELQQLSNEVRQKSVAQTYHQGSSQTIAIAALQTLLYSLGFGDELNWERYGADGQYGVSTVDAVKAFAAQEGMVSDGTELPPELAQRIIDKLSPFYGDGWASTEGTAASQAGPLTIQTVSQGGRTRIQVSDGTQEKVFGKFKRGVFTNGNQTPLSFITEHENALRSLGLTSSAINVMIAVAENEGNLDAINTWDNAFLSFGMFQWTAGVGNEKGELPALVQRIKTAERAVFEKYYGQYGLDVVDVNATYGYFALNGKRLDKSTAKEQLRTPAWAFYFWLSGQSTEVQTFEVQHALSRLETFYTNDRYKVEEYYVSDLITSEYGVGLILDNHVNRPAYVKGCLKEALVQTGLPDPGRWGTAEERKLIAAYLKIRETYGRSPMTDASKRAAVTKKYLDNGTISDEQGSFDTPVL